MNKLILICLSFFVVFTANVVTAELLVQQKAKQIGLNTASQNQMLDKQLGTEVMVKSSKLVVINKRFNSTNPTVSGTYTIGYIPKCNVLTGVGYVSVPSTLVQKVTSPTTSTTLSVAVSGITLLTSTTVASAPVQGAAASATATLTSLSGCDRDVPIVLTVSGTITSGQFDIIIPYIPYNQTQ